MTDIQNDSIAHEESPHVVLGYQLDNLRVFLCAASERSVVGAAKKLYMTPSAVSRSIHELEKALGVSLFERSSRGILLSSYGRIVLARALRINVELQQAIADLMQSGVLVSSPSLSTFRSILFNGRKLQLLVLLTVTRKLSEAATQMGMTQSGASMALSRIESSLGLILFERTKRGLIPFAGGDHLAMQAKRVFAEFRHMLSDLSVESGRLEGWVSIGTSSRGRTVMVPAAIGAFLAMHPRVHVSITEMSFDQMIVALRSGELDAVIGVAPDGYGVQDLTVEPLFTDRVTIFARAEHPLAQRSGVTLSRLVRERWILPRTNTPARKTFEQYCRREGLQPPVPSVESSDLAVTRQLLMTSDMLAVASTLQFQFEVNLGLLKKLGPPLAGSAVNVSLLLREGAMLSSTAIALLDAIRVQSKNVES